jgi:hypothetical protein
MNRKLIVYLVLLFAVIGLLIYVDASRPKPIDWRATYSTRDKIPFGLYIFDKEAPTLFKGNKFKKLSETPYEFFDSLYDYKAKKYKAGGNFIEISDTSELDKESVLELVYFADHGNTVFISTQDFPRSLMDTLGLSVASTSLYVKDSLTLTLNKQKDKKYDFTRGSRLIYFDSIDSNRVQVLGYQNDVSEEARPNFIRIPFGDGSFMLHTQPAAFTNYHLLKNDHYKYAEGVLSYLPEGNIYWYSKSFVHRTEISGSPLRYILSQPALKWAMWIGLIALLIFILFQAKRKQRVIPQITPLKNTTVDFAKTIGNLYYQEGNHDTIIEKKITYFLEHVRNEYNIDTYSLDDKFVEKLHLKTGKPVEDIEKTVSLIKKHRHVFKSTEADVLAINKAIENLRL